MADDAQQDELVDFVAQIVRNSVQALRLFPMGYRPPESQLPLAEPASFMEFGADFEEILAQDDVIAFVREKMDGLPPRFLGCFLEAGGALGQILAHFGVGQHAIQSSFLRLMLDESHMNLMMAVAEHEKDARRDNTPGDEDQTGFKKVAMRELKRRSLAGIAPYAHLLTTLLGEDALSWLTAPSSRGVPNMQPHEFSRDGWHRLSEIETQVAIENELTSMDLSFDPVSKCVVAASWTLVALASHIDSACFVGEHAARLLSQRSGQYTMGGGLSSRVLLDFEPNCMASLLDILREGLTTPLISAADLMWIAASLAHVRRVKVRFQEPTPPIGDRFGIFLSHRGRDAKLELARLFEDLPAGHGVFLDCMTLPRGVINRSFVYNALANAETVVIVESDHFAESAWCRKEAWLSDAMAARGLIRTERLSLSQAVARIRSDGSSTLGRRRDPAHAYPIVGRVMKDIDYWARHPNQHSLEEAGISLTPLAPLRALLDRRSALDEPSWRDELATAIVDTLTRTVAAAPDGDPADLWATALQLALAAFGLTSNGRSKDEVRRGVDDLNRALKELLGLQLQRDPEFRANAPAYLALLAGAVATHLSGFGLDSRLLPTIHAAVTGAAILHDQLLLLDARQGGPIRDFRLRFAVALIKCNIGSVGIIQNAWDEVHRGEVDGMALEVLPCVTMHRGMDDLPGFASAAAR